LLAGQPLKKKYIYRPEFLRINQGVGYEYRHSNLNSLMGLFTGLNSWTNINALANYRKKKATNCQDTRAGSIEVQPNKTHTQEGHSILPVGIGMTWR
jgi:hypothetical protein